MINIDITVFKDGVHGDTSRTIIIGEKEQIGDDEHYEKAKKLLQVSHAALLEGIAQCKAGESTLKIAEAVEDFVNKNGFTVVPGLTGHGIGEYFHEAPYIVHNRDPYMNYTELQENMTFTIGK